MLEAIFHQKLTGSRTLKGGLSNRSFSTAVDSSIYSELECKQGKERDSTVENDEV